MRWAASLGGLIVGAVGAGVAGCGDTALTVDGGLPEPADASHDAAIDASWTSGTIQVTARNLDLNPIPPANVPGAGLSVVFIDATDHVEVVTTDVDGVAQATVTGPTTVTLVRRRNVNSDELLTIYDAMPGDDLLFERNYYLDNNAGAGLTVNFAAAANTSYAACTPSGCAYGATAPLLVPVRRGWAQDPMPVALFATSGGATSFAVGSTSYSIDDGGTISLAPSLAVGELAATLSNVTAEITGVGFRYHDGRNHMVNMSFPSGPDVSAQLQRWDAFGSGRASMNIYRGDGASQVFVEETSSASTSMGVDLANERLPWLAAPAYDPATRSVRISGVSGVREGDLVMAMFYFVNANNRSLAWHFFAPRPGVLPLPAIPATVVDAVPLQVAHKWAAMSDVDSVAGYAEARRDPLGVLRAAWLGSERSATSISPNLSPMLP